MNRHAEDNSIRHKAQLNSNYILSHITGRRKKNPYVDSRDSTKTSNKTASPLHKEPEQRESTTKHTRRPIVASLLRGGAAEMNNVQGFNKRSL